MKTAFGWHCTLLHDYPEPEGLVFFQSYDEPIPGQRFLLPSSGCKEEWQVKTVDRLNMSFTAIKPEEVADEPQT